MYVCTSRLHEGGTLFTLLGIRICILLIVCFGISSFHADEVNNKIFKLKEALEKCDISCALKEITDILSNFAIKANATEYQTAFRVIFMSDELKARLNAQKDRMDLLKVSLEKAHFIFKLLVNKTAEEALTWIEELKNTFFSDREDRDVFFIGMNFEYVNMRRVIYTWIVNSYFGNGTLKKSFPPESGNFTYCRDETNSSVNTIMRREPVRDHYDIQERIGRGLHGTVYKCIEKRSGNIFAARFVRIWLDFQRKMIYDEIGIMNELSHPGHPNLLSLHEAFDNDPDIIMIVDFLEGKLDSGWVFIEPGKNDYVRQICEGLRYMHARNIVHMDVRLPNVGYTITEGVRVVKLIDFGTAQRIGQVRVMKLNTVNEFHSHDFDTPEMLENRTLGAHTDMWNVGVLTFFLLTEDYPLWGRNCSEIEKNIKACRWNFFEMQKELLPDKALDFIGKLFVKDIKKRMTADECLKHPWIVDGADG